MTIFKTDQDVEIYVNKKAKEWLDERDRVMSKGGVFMLDVRRDLLISELPPDSKYYSIHVSDLIRDKINK
jgi:hypothetical protein